MVCFGKLGGYGLWLTIRLNLFGELANYVANAWDSPTFSWDNQ